MCPKYSNKMDFKFNLHYIMYEKFLKECIIPEALAYYIFSAYCIKILEPISFIRYCNSGFSSTFCGNLEIDEQLKNKIKKILKTKYHLEIQNEDTIKIKEI